MREGSLLTALHHEENGLPENMVAAAVYVEGGESSHAALIVRHNNNTHILHLFGSVILEKAADAVLEGRFIFIKQLDFIPAFLVPSFLAHCQLIKQEANPQYGFFYDPRAFYDSSGKYQNPGTFPEYMTCVGFCLTVLQSYLINEEFLYYEDWDQTSNELTEFHENRTAYQMIAIQRNYPDLKPEDLMKVVRRILPIEYFSGAYSDKRPVRKVYTDEMSAKLLSDIAQKVA